MTPIIKWTVTFGLFLLMGFLGQAMAQPLFGSTWDPLAGSSVFGSKGCARCHAINGAGGEAGPDLARIPERRSFYDLAAAMWNHLPRMIEGMRQSSIRAPRLNPQETGDLIAFLYTLNYFDPPGNLAAGRGLFIEKKCVICHQVGGIGGVLGPNLDILKQYGSPIFVATAMWNHGPAMVEAMRTKGITRPTFKASELIDLIAYLRAASPVPAEGPLYVFPGRADAGSQFFIQKRCIECHRLEGSGALWSKAGPALDRREHLGLTQFAAAMWNKLPSMLEAMQLQKISPPRLQAREMADLVAYLYSVQYLDGQGDSRKGRELVAEKKCLECHSVSGKEGKSAADLAHIPGLDSPTTVVSVLWNHAFAMAPSMKARKTPWPRLSPREMADLVAFLQSAGQSR